MKVRTIFKLSVLIAPLVAALALGGPASEAATPPILVDTAGPTATDCGKYSGDTVSNPDPVNAINAAPSGGTVIICPGLYDLAGKGAITIDTKSKITIKRALTGDDSRPVLKIDGAVGTGVSVSTSTGITIDGVVVDGSGNTNPGYIGISLAETAATIKNSAIIGPNGNYQSQGIFIYSNNVTAPARTISVSDTWIVGYSNTGIYATGKINLSLTGLHMDGLDGGRITHDTDYPVGIYLRADDGGPEPMFKISKSRIMNNAMGIFLGGIDKASISGNTLSDNDGASIMISTGTSMSSADGSQITGNTFLGGGQDGSTIMIFNLDAAARSIKGTKISNNTFVAAPIVPIGIDHPFGVQFALNTASPANTTAIMSGNTFVGFVSNRRISNFANRATVTVTKNDALP